VLYDLEILDLSLMTLLSTMPIFEAQDEMTKFVQGRGGMYSLAERSRYVATLADVQIQSTKILSDIVIEYNVHLYAAPPIARPLILMLRMSKAPNEPKAPHATVTMKTLSIAKT